MELLDRIAQHLATSPCGRSNQVSVTCRRLNVVWRRMHVPLVRGMLRHTIDSIAPSSACHLNLLDLEDII